MGKITSGWGVYLLTVDSVWCPWWVIHRTNKDACVLSAKQNAVSLINYRRFLCKILSVHVSVDPTFSVLSCCRSLLLKQGITNQNMNGFNSSGTQNLKSEIYELLTTMSSDCHKELGPLSLLFGLKGVGKASGWNKVLRLGFFMWQQRFYDDLPSRLMLVAGLLLQFPQRKQ